MSNNNGNRSGLVRHPGPGQVQRHPYQPQIPAGTMPLGHGGNVTAVPSWDKLGPLSESTDMNRGGNALVSEGQTDIVVADLRPPGWVVGHNLIVVLGIHPIGQPDRLLTSGFVDAAVRAKIRWGIGSAEFNAKVDWLNGTQLVIAAEQITVKADFVKRTFPEESPDDGVEPRRPICFQLAAAFAYGSVGKHSNPSRLTELVQVPSTTAPNNVQRIAIPDFATSFTVLVAGAESGDVALADVYGYGSSYFVRHVIHAPESNVGQLNTEFAFPIQNGAKFVDITNTKATDEPLIVFVVFGLAL